MGIISILLLVIIVIVDVSIGFLDDLFRLGH